jgi:hypothetical protein
MKNKITSVTAYSTFCYEFWFSSSKQPYNFFKSCLEYNGRKYVKHIRIFKTKIKNESRKNNK